MSPPHPHQGPFFFCLLSLFLNPISWPYFTFFTTSNLFLCIALPLSEDPKHVYSNVEKTGPWKTRPIDLWGLLKSFVGQLKIGDQITKISLPAEMCHPYSMLEMVAYRQLSLFKVLYGINEEEDALKRFLIVLKYFACLPRNESHNKKPWNPILGETHVAHVVDEVNGRTEFIAEQISHHPPVSAFHLRNDQQTFEVSSNLAFTVKFSGNSAGVAVSGASLLSIGKKDEVYSFSRCIPAMLVRNLVIGTKYIVWEGECIIKCEKTGLEAKVTFKEGWSRNTCMSGSVYFSADPKKTLYTIEGNCGEEIKLNPYPKNGAPEQKKFTLVNVAEQTSDTLAYLPKEKLEPMSSVMVWGPVNAAVLEHNTQRADAEKILVEKEQRRMRAVRADKEEEYAGQYFEKRQELWVLRDGVAVSKILSGEQPTIPLTSYSARGDHVTEENKDSSSYGTPVPSSSDNNEAPHITPDESDPSVEAILEQAKHDEHDQEMPSPPTEPPSPSRTPIPQ